MTYKRNPRIDERIPENIVLNHFNDSVSPVAARYDKIPDDIIESVRYLEPFALDISHGVNPTSYMGTYSTYVVVGSGDNARFIRLYRYVESSGETSSDVRVQNLYKRIEDWRKEQENKSA